jgi:phage shock protein A
MQFQKNILLTRQFVAVVEDMQKELIEFRQTYAEVAASQKRLEKQRIQAEGLTQEWLKRAKLALENGDEVAARAALERKNQQQELATSLGNQIQAQSQAVSNLYSKMQEVKPYSCFYKSLTQFFTGLDSCSLRLKLRRHEPRRIS